jgi:EmrB/QacA subfamily drug resistance transporter
VSPGRAAEAPAPAEAGLSLRSAVGRVALTATVAASGMASLDATVVNVALPHIGRDLHASVSSLQWVLTGYLLALASLILLGGAMGDRYGRRKIFLIGSIWFAVASALCAAAPNVEVLVAARVLEGVGAALLTPGSLAILQASFRPVDRSRAVGAWSGLGGVAGAAGPFIGGWLVDGPGWRWVFLLNIPLGLLVVVCTVVAVPETRNSQASGRLDLMGAAIGVVSLGAATWALTEAGPRGWGSPSVVVGAAVAVIGGAAFVYRMTHAKDPLVPPRLFSSRDFTVTNVATVALYAAIGVSFFLVAYQLQVGAGWSAFRSGIALLPATVLMLLLSEKSGEVAQRIGPRLQLTVGPLMAAGGLLWLSRIGSHPSWERDVLPASILLGLGLTTFVAPLTATVMGAVGEGDVSIASGVNNAVARTASLASLSVVPVVSGLFDATGPAAVTDAFRISMIITAICAATASPICFFGLRPEAPTRDSARRTICPVDGPPLEPDPRLCPVPPAAGISATGAVR